MTNAVFLAVSNVRKRIRIKARQGFLRPWPDEYRAISQKPGQIASVPEGITDVMGTFASGS
jgi:hypothetical protein